MEIINYSNINGKIEEYSLNRCCISEVILDNNNIDFLIKNVLKRKDVIASDIHDLEITYFDEFDVIRYHVRNEKFSSNLLIVDKNKRRLFSMEHSSMKNSEISNEDITCCIYNTSTNKIQNKIRVRRMSISNTKVEKITTYKKIKNSAEYDRDYYELYFANDEILSVKKNNRKYFSNVNGMNLMIKTTEDSIEAASNLILSTFDEILGEKKVKEYNLKREGKKSLVKVYKK